MINNNKKATASLILGILSIVFILFIFLIAPALFRFGRIIVIAFAIHGLLSALKANKEQRSGMATAGFILCIISPVLCCIFTLLVQAMLL